MGVHLTKKGLSKAFFYQPLYCGKTLAKYLFAGNVKKGAGCAFFAHPACNTVKRQQRTHC